MIEQEPFRRYNEEKDDRFKVFSVKLNQDEQAQFELDKKKLNQIKDSTALKHLARIGSKVIHDKLYGHIIDEVLGNLRKNKRLGIPDFE